MEEFPEVLKKVSEDDTHKFSRSECILSFAVALLSFGFVRFVLFNPTGFITTGLYIAIITSVIIFLKKRNSGFQGLTDLSRLFCIFSVRFFRLPIIILSRFLMLYFFSAQVHILYTLLQHRKISLNAFCRLQ